MEFWIVLRANLKKYRGTLAGLFLLVFIIALSLTSVLAVWSNSNAYIVDQMEQLRYGDLTAWVSNVEDIDSLKTEISDLVDVEQIGVQPLVFANYNVNGNHSDSEGQLLGYDPRNYPYRIFDDDLHGYQSDFDTIRDGEIYVSPSLVSMFDVSIGDEISFQLSRSGQNAVFKVAGYFEDPYLGSSMIGMKSFLINTAQQSQLAQATLEYGIDGLARSGQMLHIYQEPWSELSFARFNVILNQETSLPNYIEFVHSSEAMQGFMMIMQNVFSGFLAAFVVVLIGVALIVLSHSIAAVIESDFRDMGVLKTMGFTSEKLQLLQLVQYGAVIVTALAVGMAGANLTTIVTTRIMVTTTGIAVPAQIPVGWSVLLLTIIALALLGFVSYRAGMIQKVTPYKAIAKEGGGLNPARFKATPIPALGLDLFLALRQLVSSGKQYAGVVIVAALLVFFTSLMGRVDSWLGPGGEGLMDAFNPAELDLGVQPLGNVDMIEVEQLIESHTPIIDQYALAMPTVRVEGIDYEANVITDSSRFHILTGRTIESADEIVVTEFVADDLDISIEDEIMIASGSSHQFYRVVGIYQCANDLGANIGMSKEGYDQIGPDNYHMWCRHYYLGDPSIKPLLIDELEAIYGGALFVHENTWPGLFGIINAMDLLLMFMYVVAAVFILVVVGLSSHKIIRMEQRDLGIYKAMGFSNSRLRLMFSMRYGLTAFIGAVIGLGLGSLLTDSLVALVMRLYGISNFASNPQVLALLTPPLVVTLTFFLSGYLHSALIKRVDVSILVSSR